MGDKLGFALTERSTWIGILGLLSLFGIHIAPEYKEYILEIAIGFGSILNIFLKRNSNVR